MSADYKLDYLYLLLPTILWEKSVFENEALKKSSKFQISSSPFMLGVNNKTFIV
jgi:hypothetical protein